MSEKLLQDVCAAIVSHDSVASVDFDIDHDQKPPLAKLVVNVQLPADLPQVRILVGKQVGKLQGTFGVDLLWRFL